MKCILTVLFFGGILHATQDEFYIKFAKDDREWHLDYQNSSGSSFIAEFTLEGETVNDWSELITVQAISVPSPSLRKYYSEFIRNLKDAAVEHEVQKRLILKERKSIFFEWWIHEDSPEAQHEWVRAFKREDRIYILRYTTKKIHEVEKVRPIWEKNLRKARLKSGSIKNVDELVHLSPKVENRVFTDPEKTFSIEIPSNWEVQRDDVGGILFIVPPSKGTLSICAPLESDLSEDEILHGMVELRKREDASCKLIRHEKINLPNGESIEGVIVGPTRVGSQNEIPINTLVVVNHGRMIFATAPVEIFEEMLPIFKERISTFVVHEPSSWWDYLPSFW